MQRYLYRTVALAGLWALAACDGATDSTGRPSDVAVRVFVDADGSGAFSGGDVPLAGVAVRLLAASGAETTAQTGADGRAVFAGTEPGAYRIRTDAQAPAGAVLASAAELPVSVQFTGGEVNAEFRFVYLPGTVSGVVFRDENGNGAFDAELDTPAGGLGVRLFAGAGTEGAPLATATTGAAGEYGFGGLRPGAYTVVFSPFPTIQLVGDSVRPVTVEPGAPAGVDVRFTGSLVLPIAEAVARPDSASVTVEGVAYVRQGPLGSGAIYMQDRTGGVLVFNVPADAAVAEGDSLRVSGLMITFNGEREIVRFSAQQPPAVEKLGTGTVPAPRGVSGAEVAARTFEGRLVRAQGLTVTGVSSSSATPTGHNVEVRAADGTAFQLRVEFGVGIAPASWTVGAQYTVTGALGYRATNATNGVAQLKPRSAADVVLVPTGIAREKTADVGSTVTVEGVVNVPQGVFNARSVYLQDRFSGIQVFRIAADAGLQVGDSIRVTGRLAAFNQELQLDSVVGQPLQVVRLGTGTVPAPRVLTGAQVLGRQAEGMLARTGPLTVTAVSSSSTSPTGHNVDVRAEDGSAFQLRLEFGAGIAPSSWTVGAQYTVTGVLGYRATNDTNGVPQLKPRSAADITTP